jgi:hypothetical protein
MSQADTSRQQDHRGGHEELKAFFFYVGQRIVSTLDVASGAEIKAMIKAAVPSFDPTHTLVLEGHGREEDRVINDGDKVSLVVGHGDEPKHFYSKPPTNFGEA